LLLLCEQIQVGLSLLLILTLVVRRQLIFTASTGRSRAQIRYEDLQKYFIEYDPHMPAKLNRVYEQWANAKGADCEECLLIANLFNQAIDSAKTGMHFASQIIFFSKLADIHLNYHGKFWTTSIKSCL